MSSSSTNAERVQTDCVGEQLTSAVGVGSRCECKACRRRWCWAIRRPPCDTALYRQSRARQPGRAAGTPQLQPERDCLCAM